MSDSTKGQVWRLKVEPRHKLVLLAIADASNDAGFSEEGINALSSKTGYCKRNLVKIIDELSKPPYEAIEIVRKSKKGSYNRYRLAIDHLPCTPPRKLISSKKIIEERHNDENGSCAKIALDQKIGCKDCTSSEESGAKIAPHSEIGCKDCTSFSDDAYNVPARACARFKTKTKNKNKNIYTGDSDEVSQDGKEVDIDPEPIATPEPAPIPTKTETPASTHHPLAPAYDPFATSFDQEQINMARKFLSAVDEARGDVLGTKSTFAESRRIDPIVFETIHEYGLPLMLNICLYLRRAKSTKVRTDDGSPTPLASNMLAPFSICKNVEDHRVRCMEWRERCQQMRLQRQQRTSDIPVVT